jgi:ABC-type antimicrobial peptide transport system permease subunit
MIRFGLSYGLLSTRRRLHALLLPVVTTATGAFLLVEVFGLTGSVRAQAASLGSGEEVYRATLLIAVVVLLVGVVEVAVCTTRTIAHRTKEIGVLGATGVPRPAVAAALLVEPTAAALAGGVAGCVAAVVVQTVLAATGLSDTGPAAGATAVGALLAVVVSGGAALLTSAVPAWRAASRPPVHSLTSA